MTEQLSLFRDAAPPSMETTPPAPRRLTQEQREKEQRKREEARYAFQLGFQVYGTGDSLIPEEGMLMSEHLCNVWEWACIYGVNSFAERDIPHFWHGYGLGFLMAERVRHVPVKQ